MSIHAMQLLKRLEPAVMPAGVPALPGAPRPTFESRSFDQLLSMVAQSGVQSGRQIEIGIEVNPPLDSQQMERLATAADQAEVEGAQRALLLMDGRAFVVDVATRQLTAELNAHSAKAHKVDCAIAVSPDLTTSTLDLKHLNAPRSV